MEDSDLFFKGLDGGLRSKIDLPRLEGLNLLEVSIDAVIKAFELGLEAL